MNREGAPCHALQELPPQVAGVQGKRLRGEQLTSIRKEEGNAAVMADLELLACLGYGFPLLVRILINYYLLACIRRYAKMALQCCNQS
jgi:hypothetical protein